MTKSFSSVIRHGPGVPYQGSGHRLPASVHRVPLLPCIKDLLIHTWIRTDSIVGIYMSGVCRCLRSKRQPAWKSERLVGPRSGLIESPLDMACAPSPPAG